MKSSITEKLIILLMLLGLSGCAFGPSMTIQQQENIEKCLQERCLRTGMTKDEVRFIMGECQETIKPLLRPSWEIWTYTSHSFAVEHGTPVGDVSRKIRLRFTNGELREAIRNRWLGFTNLLQKE